ncbi:MAG: hypothetical protein IKH61_12920 [Bacteroidales bacterium]|mgnify:CR=1 FL=1|nr:hypothetical protein [Bacteroidales bacterium]
MKTRFGHNEFCLQGIGATPRTAQTRGAKYTLQTLENQPSERSQGRQSVNLEESPVALAVLRFSYPNVGIGLSRMKDEVTGSGKPHQNHTTSLHQWVKLTLSRETATASNSLNQIGDTMSLTGYSQIYSSLKS